MYQVNVFDFKIIIQQQVQKDTFLQVYIYTTKKKLSFAQVLANRCRNVTGIGYKNNCIMEG